MSAGDYWLSAKPDIFEVEYLSNGTARVREGWYCYPEPPSPVLRRIGWNGIVIIPWEEPTPTEKP